MGSRQADRYRKKYAPREVKVPSAKGRGLYQAEAGLTSGTLRKACRARCITAKTFSFFGAIYAACASGGLCVNHAISRFTGPCHAILKIGAASSPDFWG